MGIVAIIPLRRTVKTSINPIDSNFYKLLLLVFFITLIRLADFTYGWFQSGIEFMSRESGLYTMGAYLKVGLFVVFIIMSAEIIFILSLYDLREFYSLPVVATIFFCLALYQFESDLPVMIYNIPFLFITVYFFVSKGIKGRNGLVFSLGIFIFVDFTFEWAIAFTANTIYMYYGTILGLFIFALGTWGWFDEHLFYDREKAKKIRQNWINRRFNRLRKKDAKQVNDNAPIEVLMVNKQPSIREKTLQVECKSCKKTFTIKVTPEERIARFQNPQGIIKKDFQCPNGCDDSIIAFIDRNYVIRAYEKTK